MFTEWKANVETDVLKEKLSVVSAARLSTDQLNKPQKHLYPPSLLSSDAQLVQVNMQLKRLLGWIHWQHCVSLSVSL